MNKYHRREEIHIHRRIKTQHKEKELEINIEVEARNFYKKFNSNRKDFDPTATMSRDKRGETLSEREKYYSTSE